MGLSERLARYAVRRAHVLVVETPGAWVTRARVEGAVIERGWRLALSPADADVLAVCGAPGPELTAVIERLWEQLPGPRVKIEVQQPQVEAVTEALEAAAADLADTEQHRHDARTRTVEPDVESSDHDMDHGDMDHGDMEMAPGGIPLAGSDDDRDGLEMDVLHLRLGPVLPHWPAGLVLRCTLQGDVVIEAEGYLVDSADDQADAPEVLTGRASAGATAYRASDLQQSAWRSDNVARLLALAGWEDAAARARSLRDAYLSATTDETATALDRLRRQVTRSRTLRWSLRGLRPLTAEGLTEHGLPEHLEGDGYDRLLTMLARLPGGSVDQSQQHDVNPDAVASLVVGLDLAAARLVVASLDPPPLPTRVVTHA